MMIKETQRDIKITNQTIDSLTRESQDLDEKALKYREASERLKESAEDCRARKRKNQAALKASKAFLKSYLEEKEELETGSGTTGTSYTTEKEGVKIKHYQPTFSVNLVQSLKADEVEVGRRFARWCTDPAKQTGFDSTEILELASEYHEAISLDKKWRYDLEDIIFSILRDLKMSRLRCLRMLRPIMAQNVQTVFDTVLQCNLDNKTAKAALGYSINSEKRRREMILDEATPEQIAKKLKKQESQLQGESWNNNNNQKRKRRGRGRGFYNQNYNQDRNQNYQNCSYGNQWGNYQPSQN